MSAKRILNYVVITSVVYILSILELYSYSYKYAEYKSSVCMDCSLIEEIVLIGLFNSIVFLFFLIISKFFNLSNKVNNSILVCIFSLLLFFNNINIFDTRVASWSTYTSFELFISVLENGIIYVFFFAIIFYLYLQKIYFKVVIENNKKD